MRRATLLTGICVALLSGLGCERRPEGEAQDVAEWPAVCADLAVRDPGAEGALPLRAGANVLLITVDTLRADHLGAYGYERPTSPGLDALAAEGTRFERAYSTAPWTVPALGSLLTGTFPDTHQATFHAQIHPELKSMAEVLAERGYRTAAHVDSAAPTVVLGMDRGFDLFGNDPTDLGEILAWVHSSDQPFFLWLHYLDPHAPYDARAEDREVFWQGPFRADLATRTYAAGECPVLAEGEREQLVALYDAEILETDARIAALLSSLRETDLWASTVVAMTADHGEELFERGACGHGHSLYDDQVRVPLILRVPDLAPRVVDETVGMVDLAPSLLALVGATVPGTMQGTARIARLASPDTVERPGEAYIGMDADAMYALVRGGQKLVRHYRFPLAWELYDLEEDPDEVASRFDPELHGELVDRLACWREGIAHAHGRAPVSADIRASDEERLRALGYLGG